MIEINQSIIVNNEKMIETYESSLKAMNQWLNSINH